MDWIQVGHEREGVVTNTAINLWFMKGGGFLDQLNEYTLLNEGSPQGIIRT
jgi:hypothetical protein